MLPGRLLLQTASGHLDRDTASPLVPHSNPDLPRSDNCKGHIMTRYILGAAVVAAILPAAAQAQSFDGPYVGAQIGFNHEDASSGADTTGTVATDGERDSFVGGVYAGYDHQFANRIVIGAEAGFQIAADDRITGSSLSNFSIDPRYSFDLSARAGYVVTDTTLLYARGGYSNTRARVNYTIEGDAVSDVRTLDGWFVGGGVERKITDNISARLEYRYHDLGEGGDDFERHQALVGVSYRF